MALLALLRHGPTAWTAERRLQGRVDLPLSSAGRAAVARWQLPPEVEGFAWIASPLGRARETAELLGHGDSPVDSRLAEMSFGEWEGRRLDEISAELGTAMAEMEDRGLDFRAPGGESPREVQERLAPFLAETGRSGINRLAVTHKAVIRALYALATGWPMLGRPPHRLMEFGLHLFAVSGKGGLSLRRLNLPLALASENQGGLPIASKQ
jgi:broad specificity phosphatase PhoE